MFLKSILVICFSLFFLSVSKFVSVKEIRFRESIFDHAVDIDVHRIDWKQTASSEIKANEEEALKETIKIFYKNDAQVSNLNKLKRHDSFIPKNITNDEDPIAVDWDNLNDCLDEINIWLNDLEKGELYALQMIDSWGTQEGGILEGNVRWFGHYYECIDAIGPRVRGKYCTAYYGFLYYPQPFGIPIDATIGLCFPSACSEQSTEIIYQTYFALNNTIPLLDVKCSEKPQWSTIDTIGTSITAALLSMAVVGLVLDLVKRAENASDQRYSMPTQLILSFSPLANAEKILDSSQRPGTLPALDGIRFISTTWVILGHTISVMFYGLDNSIHARKRMTSDPSFQVIINETVSVDTFFLLSGLLVAYLGMKHLHQTKGRINIPLMYLQRYLRLTPVYAFLILFSMGYYKFFGAGPVWNTDALYYECKDNWWINLLYISNLYPVTNYCYGVAWYLANDMQFYILAPFFLILLYRWRVVGIVSVCLVVVGGMITTGVLSSLNNLQPTTVGVAMQLSIWFRILFHFIPEQTYESRFNSDIYTTPWTRINVYMIGMLTGYILFVTKRKIKMHKAVVVIGWLTATGSALGIIYGLYDYFADTKTMEVNLAAFYNAVNRPVWSICVAWVIIACSSGYGGPVTKFLNWKLFTPLSRLTYSVYMVHILIIQWHTASQEKPLHFSTPNFVYIFLGTLVISFGWGFVISLFIEWPFIGLFKVIFSSANTMKPKVQNSNDESRSTENKISRPEQNLSKLSRPTNGDIACFSKENCNYNDVSVRND